ncbi:MAG: methyltransferase domain-containing protein [Candidatus Riflebacteria bacterium]|nr:methyltransferase domain-containing protein [Candidatus Riflebacteria bacterium]
MKKHFQNQRKVTSFQTLQYRYDQNCRLCGSERISSALKLQDTPLEDQFLKVPTFQPTFPLELALCENCGYLHLPYIISPEASYSDYMYVSGVTVGLRNHYDAYAEEIVTNYNIPKGSLIVDLGSNDGSMLASFKRIGMQVQGVEPATATAKLANDNGLQTINDFFTDNVATQIIQEYGMAQVVTANYVYANIDDVISFTKAVVKLLSPSGIFVVETGYHPEQMNINMFDYIYHEHFSYFTVEVLKNLFSKCSLELIRATKTTPKGGSIQLVCQPSEKQKTVADSVEKLISDEYRLGMRNIETYHHFGKKIQNIKNNLLDFLKNIKSKGEKIIGFGASHSTTTLMYHFELAPYLDFLVDDNQLKHGTFSPGHHIPVHPSSRLYEENPAHVLVLAWQHQKTILEKHSSLIKKGFKFILPLPEFRIV